MLLPGVMLQKIGKAHKKAFEGKFEGTEFVCASIDYVGFKPVKIL